MHDITVNDVDPAVVAWITACAEHNGRDVGDEARLVLLDNMGIDTAAERAADRPGAPKLAAFLSHGN